MFFLLYVVLGLLAQPVHASTVPDGAQSSQDDGTAYKDRKSKEEKEEEISEAEKEAEKKRKEKLARVIVLKWPDVETDYQDTTVRRNVRARIARPEAMFFPAVDLYQNGRKVKDRTVIPAMQPAIVPDSNVPAVMAAIDQVSGLHWNALQPAEWGLKAQELRDIAEQLWFIDRVELREPMFLLYSQIGRAAENQNFSAPPFYEQIGPFAVNYYWYLAATLAYQEPALMSKLTDQDLSGSIGYYLTQLQQGQFPSIKVDFELENFWDEELFSADYELLINGIPIVPDTNGYIDVFLGRTDIYLRRTDSGHGLSERLEVAKLDEKAYNVMDVANKKMGIDFVDQLFLHKNECTPEVDGDILNYLAIYQKLHSKAEVYIAVPENGNANKMWIWRYDQNSAQLSLVAGANEGFPVRFALLFSSGVLHNGAAITADDDPSDEDSLAPEDLVTTDRVEVSFDEALVPFNFELRGHYNRLMLNFGFEGGYNLRAGGDSAFAEYYQHPRRRHLLPDENDVGAYQETCTRVDTDGDGEKDSEECTYTEVLNERTFNHNLYGGVAMVFGRDAGIGFGPRIAARVGAVNLPHGIQTTGHFGWSLQPPIGEFANRFRPLVDADLRGGILISTDRSLQKEIAELSETDSEGIVEPVFGITLGVGFTF